MFEVKLFFYFRTNLIINEKLIYGVKNADIGTI